MVISGTGLTDFYYLGCSDIDCKDVYENGLHLHRLSTTFNFLVRF